MDKILGVIIFMGISLFPLYFENSGSAQISHILLIIAFGIGGIVSMGIKIGYTKPIFFTLLIYLGYVICRQFAYDIEYQLNDERIYMPIAYLTANIAIYLAIINYLNEYKITSIIVYSVLLSIVFAVIGVYVYGFSLIVSDHGVVRSVGTFNNPNQLGYFSVCAISLIHLFRISGLIGRVNYIIFSTITFLLAIVSLSKAAMIAFILYFILCCFKYINAFITLAVIMVILYLMAIQLSAGNYEELQFINRLMSIGSGADDNFESRGYGTLMNPDLRLIYGWGEGYTLDGHTGASDTHSLEVHSTLGSILIGYGIIGLVIFLTFIYRIAKKLSLKFGWLNVIMLFSPAFAYGLTHNGMRFTIFWIFLASATYIGSASEFGKNNDTNK